MSVTPKEICLEAAAQKEDGSTMDSLGSDFSNSGSVMTKADIKKMREDEVLRKRLLGSGWRRELMGEKFIEYLENFDRLAIDIEGGSVHMHIKD